jgi:signal transduction histidine kinase
MNEIELLRSKVNSLEAELAGIYKRRLALDAMDAYKAHATTHAQEIADEAAAMLVRFGAHPDTYPHVADFLGLRMASDTLRREVQP